MQKVFPQMMLAAAERTVSDWLAEPRRSGSVLSLLGPVGMGKTALLRRMHERFPSSIFMDCSGLTMDEVTRRPLAEFGIDAVDPRSKDPLFDAVVKIRRDAVVVLANVHWSGPLFTSRGSATASRARWPRHPVRTAADVCAWSSKPTRPVIACESDGRTRSDGTAALAHRMVTLASVRRLRHAPGHERVVDYVELGLSDDVSVVTTQRELPLPAAERWQPRPASASPPSTTGASRNG
ncbi:ATP-binding protein [Streptomyces nigra]|uniref:ATP-binding protein n=1 Tax=Streptomyces nigra TaxID=1827580 RepID=UPI00380D2520